HRAVVDAAGGRAGVGGGYADAAPAAARADAAPPAPSLLGRDAGAARVEPVAAGAGGAARRGFRARPGEQPEELARRVHVDGVGACASVLELARHGLGLQAEDLDAMHGAADLAYRAARARLGFIARVAAAVRWPLA